MPAKIKISDRILLPLLLLISIASVVFVFYTKNKNEKHGEPKTTDTPEKTVETFYTWYKNFSGNPLVSGAYKASPYLTPDLIKKIDYIILQQGSDLKGLGFDPVICAVDKPLSFRIGNSETMGDTAIVELIQDFGEERTLKIGLMEKDGEWLINNVGCPAPEESPLQKKEKISLFFSKGDSDCTKVHKIEREIDHYSDALRTALNLLFWGPTEYEKQDGYTSLFSPKTKSILKSIRIVDKIAYVDFRDFREIIPNASASCASQSFISQVTGTIKNYENINKVIFAIDGNPKTFYDFMQIGCNKENNMCSKEMFE